MAIELIGAKIIAPFFGTSTYVWASIFTITLLGLAIGYIFGGYFSKKKDIYSNLSKVLALSIISIFYIYFTQHSIQSVLLSLPISIGIIISSLLILAPILICFGIVSPLAIQILNDLNSSAGKSASSVYGTSTFGGVICTFIFGFYIIPFQGLEVSLIVISILLAFSFFISLRLKKISNV